MDWLNEEWMAALVAMRERSSAAEILAIYQRGGVHAVQVLKGAWEQCQDNPTLLADLVRQFRNQPDQNIADVVGGGLEKLAVHTGLVRLTEGRVETVIPDANTSVFDFPPVDGTIDVIMSLKRRVKEHIRTARDPNETGENGRTLLLLALFCCFEGDGESDVLNLLERGADPNKPSPWATFTTLLTASSSLPLVKKFVESGLRLNDVYEIRRDQGGMTDGPSTLLDHLYGVRNYISPKRKKLNALANEYAGGLGKRRRFIDETIALLESSSAKRAADLPPT